jgi:beta-xylosidase
MAPVMRMRVRNDRHIVSFHTSGDDGKTWHRFDRGMEVSGYHHNVRGGFLMLRPGLCSGQGEALFAISVFVRWIRVRNGRQLPSSPRT